MRLYPKSAFANNFGQGRDGFFYRKEVALPGDQSSISFRLRKEDDIICLQIRLASF
jgi:hypothetical protein